MLCQLSAATIDRRLAEMTPRCRSHTKPGSLLKSQIPVCTWADWDDAVPGFVEIDLVGHDGGNSSAEFCFTLTVTDIATGWTVNRSVRNKAQKLVFAALHHVVDSFPFPILGIDSDNGSEFINDHLLRWRLEHKVNFTRSRPGNKNDGAHVEQKNWTRVRELVGYYRYHTPGKLAKSTRSGNSTPCSPSDRPPDWCDAHHILPWSHGGTTNITNLILLCRKHHTTVHYLLPQQKLIFKLNRPGKLPPGACQTKTDPPLIRHSPYGHTGHDSADPALTALGFRRITEWDNQPDADTCLARWR